MQGSELFKTTISLKVKTLNISILEIACDSIVLFGLKFDICQFRLIVNLMAINLHFHNNTASTKPKTRGQVLTQAAKCM